MAKTTPLSQSRQGSGKSRGKASRRSPRRVATPTAAAATAVRNTPEPPKAWTFLTNHAHVLIVLYDQPGLVLREVAARVGITERAVQRIVQDLEEEGFIRREKVGRKNQYEVLTNKALRHPVEWHRNIGDLIRLITD